MTREKPTRGQPFRPKAGEYGEILGLLDEKGVPLPGRADASLSTSRCQFKNASGALLGRFNVIVLGALSITDASNLDKFLDNMVLSGAAPSVTSYSRDVRIGITDDSLAINGIGDAIVSGLVPCKVNVVSALHKYARPTSTDCTKLTSDWWGQCRILAQESGTGDKWALVQVGNYFDHSYIGKFISDVGDESTGTATVWSGIGAGAVATAGTIENVYNRYAELLEADKFARVSWDNDGPECVAIRCV